MRCICCDSKFRPNIIYDKDGKFVRFEELCQDCVALAFEEETYDDVFGNVRVSDKTGILNYIPE